MGLYAAIGPAPDRQVYGCVIILDKGAALDLRIGDQGKEHNVLPLLTQSNLSMVW